jgi:serine protease
LTQARLVQKSPYLLLMKYVNLLLSLLLMSGPALATSPPPPLKRHPSTYRLPAGATPADYRAGVVVFRVADAGRTACSANHVEIPAIQRVLTRLGATHLERVFPHVLAPTAADLKRDARCVDLTTVYRVAYAAPVPVDQAAGWLLATGAVRYAEPDFVGRPRYTPNDPSAPQQYALAQIHALDAWDVQKGDTTVLIGIVDTGVDLDHPDLVANLQRNYADPVNGVDDDNDGYIDNYLGWDMVGAFVNQPAGDNGAGGSPATYHGTHVAGCASAVADNTIGVAGVGFRCRLLPVKCSADDNGGFILNGYPGMVYAADHGCDIINCSWGSLGFPDLGQDAINYATFNRGALVVTAAGNNGVADPFSPAGFENVLTVGASGPNDVKAGFSNYGANTEVFAPGLQIFSTLWNDNYGNNSGTSMASPVCSGAAGLVKAQFPTYTGEQVGQQLRMTCDNIDAQNPAFAGLLGRGRINVMRAITEQPSAVRFLRKQYLDGASGQPALPTAGASITIRGDFKSILKPTTGLTATLSTTSAAVTIQQATVTLGNLGTGQTVVGDFTISVSPTAPADAPARFTITYQDQAGYSDVEKFEVLLNPSFRDITANQVHTTITSRGRIGFNDNQNTQGLGMVYANRDNLIWECGLMVGTDSTHVSNTVLHIASYPPIADNHFRPVGGPVRPVVAPRADQEFVGLMNDAGAGAAALPVLIRYHTYAWSAAGQDKYVIFSYTLRNPSAQPLSNLYAGLYADWDIGGAITNKADWDAARRLGYAYSNEPDSAFAGIRLLAPATAQPTYRAIDFDASLPGNPWGASDTFTLGEKWRALSRGVSRTQAGLGRGSDVATVHGAGPFTLAPNDSVTVVFALVAGNNLPDLQAASDAAAAQYQQVVLGQAELLPTRTPRAPFPNPTTGRLTLPAVGQSGWVEVVDGRGSRVARRLTTGRTDEVLSLAGHPAGLYIVRFVPANGSRSLSWRILVE